MTLVQKEVKRITMRPLQTEASYTISNIPTNDTNKYVLVWAVNSVKFNFTFTAWSSWAWVYVHISSNNSNSDRYWLSYNKSYNSFIIRWRLSWASDTTYRNVPGFNSSWTNEVERTVNKNWECNITCNWTSTDYTAWTAELNVLQTIMNLSDMNAYWAQTWSYISWNSISIVATPQTPSQVEKQIRPVQQGLTFSYDFRNKSVSTLTNDGWERPDWNSSIGFDSNWMYKNSTGFQRAIYPIWNLTNAKTIQLVWNIYNAIDNDFNLWLEQKVNSAWSSAIRWTCWSGYQNFDVYDTSWNLTRLVSNTGLWAANRTITVTIDLVNKTASFSWWNSGTYSLQDQFITSIRASTWIRCALAKSSNRFKDISIAVTY